ncbi:uncharacterized protein [Dysidea avara]|uniref:uncharacterized protein n=1 Tax=Dysidea avara TaxID=196820 RepID=UPI0033221606
MAAEPSKASSPARSPDTYTTQPPQPREKEPGQLEKWQVDQYFEKGYVLVPNVFTPEELEPIKECINGLVDDLANKLFAAGKIDDKCEKAGFYERLTLLEKQFPGTAVLLHKIGVLPTAFQTLWTNERLLNIVEQFIGPNIAGHPVWNLRTKTPYNEQVTVPWHQDNGYLEETCNGTLLATAWIPLLDTNANNGCMQVVSEGHKLGMTAKHTCCAGGTWYIDLSEEEMVKTLGVDLDKDVITCEVPYGGVLFINNCVPHRSLENHSDKIRWSLDLRWQDPSKPNGFKMKECVVMRKADDPNYVIDWSKFANLNRTTLQEKEMGRVSIDEFDTTLYGPWMKRWEIVHHNKHTKAHEAHENSLSKLAD